MLALTRIYAGQAADYLSNTLGAGLLGPGCADEVELVNSFDVWSVVGSRLRLGGS